MNPITAVIHDESSMVLPSIFNSSSASFNSKNQQSVSEFIEELKEKRNN
jgi:hypothetical protein